MPDYISKLLASFEIIEHKSQQESLKDPLSQRELEVLLLISQGLSNAEICKKLFIALDTVKGHNRKIFSKLDVKNRTMAINKARSLKIINS